MKFAFLSIMFLIASMITRAQENDRGQLCSAVLNELSYFWKIDSLGTNGLRYYTYKKIVDSKLDFITYENLTAKLGEPNYVIKSTKDIIYAYFYLSPPKMKPVYANISGFFFIGFVQKKGSESINEIMVDSLDY